MPTKIVVNNQKGGVAKTTTCISLGAALVECGRQTLLVEKKAIHYYNTDRSHLSLNMAVPKDVYFGIHQEVPPVMIPESYLCIT